MCVCKFLIVFIDTISQMFIKVNEFIDISINYILRFTDVKIGHFRTSIKVYFYRYIWLLIVSSNLLMYIMKIWKSRPTWAALFVLTKF